VFDSTTSANVIFSDSPAYAPGGNVSIDTVTFSGIGQWNGQGGYHYAVTASDRGEPGKNLDTFTIVISAPNGSVVLSSGGTLSKGNLQSQ